MMIRSIKILALGAALGCAASGAATAQESLRDPMDNPITNAMMEVYNAELASNPESYEVYFRRANEYYKYDQYLRALSDLDNALKYAPQGSSASDFLFSTYTLRADTYHMLKKYEEALADYTQALVYDPTAFPVIAQRANTLYELGRYPEAKAEYQRMRAIDGRSPEALTGLARVAVKESNLGMASQYMDDAVRLMPSDGDVYVRRATVREMLGNNTGVVDDLISAISIDSNPRAFRMLTAMADTDYPAVITSLSNAVSQAPDNGMFYYIRAVIAQAHYHYPSAIADYRKIIDDNLYNYAGIYGSLAQCYLALCRYDEALDAVNQAIGMTADNAEYMVTLSRIRRATGDLAAALRAVDEALLSAPEMADAKVEKALCLYGQKEYRQASDLLGEVVFDNPDNAMDILTRAWVELDGLGDRQASAAIYRRLLDQTEPTADPEAPALTGAQVAAQLRGFALLFTGARESALQWADRLRSDYRDTDGRFNYLCACLYAQAGATDKALDCANAALSLGYTDLYNWKVNADARVNVAPLRDNAEYQALLKSYEYIFK